MTICERVFALLASDGREQGQMAKYIGVSKKTVSSWRSRGTSPGAEYIAPIAEYFGVSTDYILTGEERDLRLKPEDVELLTLWDVLSPADKAVVKYEMYRRSNRAEPFEPNGEKKVEAGASSVKSVG
ncbi:MAG: HTH-type transcriptional regulator Xre [Firmicutes bacterium ADurb.Bin506]|nr:MAG: HTH-type transcriptional regulator Xre [Firmicutes bacterium ADurb.Bin506]